MTILAMSATTAMIPAYATTSSNVAIIGGPIFTSGGALPISNGAFSGYIFTTIGVSPLPSLAAFDTVVLNVQSSDVGCNLSGIGGLDATELAALVTFMTNGGKLIIFDSECSTYTWLPPTLQFTTSNPGPQGATGSAVIIEQNVLSTTPVTGPADINVALLCSTDACGDANVMTALGTDLCKDIDADNFLLPGPAPAHVYSRSGGGSGSGMLIYNGFDQDADGSFTTPTPTTGSGNLAQLFLNELKAGFNPHDPSLTCGTPIIQVGGEIIPVSTTALLLAGVSTSALWLVPLAAVAVGAFAVLRIQVYRK